MNIVKNIYEEWDKHTFISSMQVNVICQSLLGRHLSVAKRTYERTRRRWCHCQARPGTKPTSITWIRWRVFRVFRVFVLSVLYHNHIFFRHMWAVVHYNCFGFIRQRWFIRIPTVIMITGGRCQCTSFVGIEGASSQVLGTFYLPNYSLQARCVGIRMLAKYEMVEDERIFDVGTSIRS